MTVPETIVIDPATPARYALICLHGLGADGHDFAPLAAQILAQTALPIRCIFPHAPLRPVTLNQGYVMRAWYDIFGLTEDTREDREGLQEAAHTVEQLITAQNKLGIPTERIFLMGFSQGGGLALYTGLRYPQRVAGIIGLSTYLPLRHHLAQEAVKHHPQPPIFIAHGTEDAILPVSWADMSARYLQEQGYNVTLEKYRMGHQVCNTEITALLRWLKATVSSLDESTITKSLPA